MSQARPRFGFPAAVFRHGVVVVLAIGAVWVLGVSLGGSVSDRPWLWLAISVGLGAVAAIVARGLMGAVFLVVGLLFGVELLLIYQHGSAAAAMAALREEGWLYAALIAVAVEAYLVVLLIVMRLRRA